MLLAKEAAEKTMARAGRTVKHYHANNGIFSDNIFVDYIKTKDQNIKFCRVGANHQNGIVKNKNKLQKKAHKQSFCIAHECGHI